MDEPQSLTPPAKPPKRRRRILRIVLAFVLLAFALLVACLFVEPQGDKVVWYTQAEFKQALKPGLLKKVKNKVLNWKWLRRFQNPSQQISFQIRLFTVPSGSDAGADLGAAASTNSSGLRLWILSPRERDLLVLRMKSSEGDESRDASKVERSKSSGNILLNASQGVTTIDEMAFEAGLLLGNPPMGLMLVDCLPEVRSDKIKITFNTVVVVTGTNFIGACRAFVPNGGAAVFGMNTINETNSPSSFVIILPDLINPDGTKVSGTPSSSK